MPANSNIRTNDPTKVPALPRIPASVGPELRRYLESIEQITSIRLGRRGDPRDRAITLRELIESGLAQELASSPWDPNRGNAGFVQGGNRLQDLAVPPAPTGFVADGAFSQVNLQWNYPAYSNHSHTEVHSHTSDVIGDAQLIGIQNGRIFVDPVGSGQTRYYWVRHVNTDSIAGPFNSASGTAATTATDVNHMLGVLTTAITSSELASSLSTPIAKIDPLETFTGFSSSYSGNSLLTRMGAVETTANGAATSAQLTSEQTTRASADTALSSSITTLQSTVGTNSTSISTQATSINGLEAKYVVKIDNNGAVAGYGLASTANSAGNITSEFIVNADRFAIMRGGSNTAAATVPFVVQASSTTLNGESVPAGVYMADAFIKNGSIASAKIGTLNADKITAGSIASARIAANSIDASKLNIDNSSLTSSVVGGVPTLQIGAVNVNTLTGNSISATIMSGTTVYANRLTGDVNKLLPFRSTSSVSFRGNAASGGGTVVVTTQQLPATTHLTVGHKPFASVTGWYDSTNGKTYSFKLYMQLGSGSYTLVGETRFKANTNLYAQFAVSGSLSTATTSVVNLKLEVTRTGSSGIFDSDTSTTVDNIYEVSGFILGAR